MPTWKQIDSWVANNEAFFFFVMLDMVCVVLKAFECKKGWINILCAQPVDLYNEGETWRDRCVKSRNWREFKSKIFKTDLSS